MSTIVGWRVLDLPHLGRFLHVGATDASVDLDNTPAWLRDPSEFLGRIRE